jgi:hypothetical protein
VPRPAADARGETVCVEGDGCDCAPVSPTGVGSYSGSAQVGFYKHDANEPISMQIRLSVDLRLILMAARSWQSKENH